jgi:hypothetical protein
MANEFLGLALANPEVLKVMAQNPHLDPRVRKIIEQIHNELMVIVHGTKEQLDANSYMYQYAMWKTQETLTAIEVMKCLRAQIAPSAELDALDQTLRKRYLEQTDQITHVGSLKVVEKSK